jgi:hypothetical protein
MIQLFGRQAMRTLRALPLVALVSCDKGDKGEAEEVTTSSTSQDSESSGAGLGPSSIDGDEICAQLTTQAACEGVEVVSGVFCGWRASAFVATEDQACAALQVSEGCFAFPSAGGDPGCGSVPECETPLGFLHPHIKEIEGGTLIVNACVGSAPSNEFTSCYSFDAPRPLGCQCVCELAPGG